MLKSCRSAILERLCPPLGAALACAMALATPGAAANLWPGETAHEVAGFPFVAKLQMVDPEAPLVVFTPGRSSTARIAYGGHEGGREDDFLAYWLNQMGYNFLGVSYPVVTRDGIFDTAHPDFNVRAWGRGTAEITRQVIESNGITGDVIHAGWSMSGKNAQPFAEAARELGLEQDFFVSMAATPPVPGVLGMDSEVKLSEQGVAAMPPGAKPGVAQMKQADGDNGRTIIPAQVLATAYLGDTPIGLMARGLRYDPETGAARRDHWADMQDTRFFDLDSFPLVATIVPTLQGDSRHVLTDLGSWSFYQSNTLFVMAGKSKGLAALEKTDFEALARLVRAAPETLSQNVAGNHFFFVGEKGARATAEAIKTLDGRVEALRTELRTLTASQ